MSYLQYPRSLGTVHYAFPPALTQLWDVNGEVPLLAHTFDAYSTNIVTWHSDISGEGDMLLAR